MGKLCQIVDGQIRDKQDSKIIVFANYRDSVKEIVNSLENIEGVRPVEFVGQKEGLTQKEQIQRISDFREGVYNVLVGTSVSEEGLDIPAMDLAVFYEPVPSEIRSIQRRGRVGRQKVGRVVFLITRRTRDEAYFWSAKNKEVRMKKTLYGMRRKQDLA
jgi:Fanconi anemia group M protein